MSEARDLLNGLSEAEYASYPEVALRNHEHIIYDTDPHFKIDPVTMAITTEAKKTVLIKGSHNCERFTFEMPKEIEGHDMSQCDKVEIHYLNVGSGSDRVEDVHKVEDFSVSPESGDVLIFSWLLDGNACKYAGTLSFAIVFKCTDGDVTTYSKPTDIFKGITVKDTINNGEAVIEERSDILQQWYDKLFASTDSVVNEAITEIQNKTDECLASIPDDYTELNAAVKELQENGGGTGGSNYPQKVFEYEWKDNYDKIDVTSIDYETGILTVSSIPTQITDDVSTTVRVFPALKIEGIAMSFKYGMMPKEIMETHSFYYAKKVGDNHVILCNPINSNELTSITNSDVVDLTRWNLFVEKKRNSAIPNVDVKNLDKTHRYKLKYYLPQNAHYTSCITIYSENEDKYGKEYGLGYQSVDVYLNEINNNPSMFVLNSYETVSLRSKHHKYNENVMTKYPRFFEVDIYKLSDKAYNADVNIGYFAPFGTLNDNTVLGMSTVKQNIFLQQPFGQVIFNTGNGNYILDGARCEVWDYGEVL